MCRTLAALNVSVDDRIAAIMANMERWRWMPRTLPVNRVQVNIAAAVLTVFQGDEAISSMRRGYGQPGQCDPDADVQHPFGRVNPPWNVPMSIAKRELFPKGRATLIKQGYKIIKTPGRRRTHRPACRAEQRAGPVEVRFCQSLRRLSARHAVSREILQL